MVYITSYQERYTERAVSFEEILSGNVSLSNRYATKSRYPRTFWVSEAPQKVKDSCDLERFKVDIAAFNVRWAHLFGCERHALYRTFSIPKHSGGLRTISAPVDDLKLALRELKEMFERYMQVTHHTAAFAYIKGRCSVDAVRRHQANQSRWFAKLDFSDFFGSTTPDFLESMLTQIFPFSEIYSDIFAVGEIRKAIDLCFLDGGLPQGTPISPLLTNIMMIPIDYRLFNGLNKFETSKRKDQKFVYTRYADDLYISSKIDFPVNDVIGFVNQTLDYFHAPFKINEKKTHYGSSAGRNWILGCMLNKDNHITIGHKKKKQFKSMINNFLRDYAAGNAWDIHDVQVMSGLLSYYRSVEEDFIDKVVDEYGKKYNVDVKQMIKDVIGGNIICA